MRESPIRAITDDHDARHAADMLAQIDGGGITLAAEHLRQAKPRATAWKGVETRERNRKAREIEEPAQQR
jgi:hypothetical protein